MKPLFFRKITAASLVGALLLPVSFAGAEQTLNSDTDGIQAAGQITLRSKPREHFNSKQKDRFF